MLVLFALFALTFAEGIQKQNFGSKASVLKMGSKKYVCWDSSNLPEGRYVEYVLEGACVPKKSSNGAIAVKYEVYGDEAREYLHFSDTCSSTWMAGNSKYVDVLDDKNDLSKYSHSAYGLATLDKKCTSVNEDAPYLYIYTEGHCIKSDSAGYYKFEYDSSAKKLKHVQYSDSSCLQHTGDAHAQCGYCMGDGTKVFCGSFDPTDPLKGVNPPEETNTENEDTPINNDGVISLFIILMVTLLMVFF